ncbi:syncoilin-like [Arapaima gigas]
MSHLEDYPDDDGSHYEDCPDDEGSSFEDSPDNQMSHSEDYTDEDTTESQLGEYLSQLGSQFERCIEEVGQLEQRRDTLVQELLQLEQPMAQGIWELREQLAEAHRRLSVVQLEQRCLQEEEQQVKWRLFITVRDCIQSQVTLATQQHDVAQFAITQEELQAQLLQLTQELSQLQEVQQKHLTALQARPPVRPRAYSDLTAGRRASLELQHYLRGGMSLLQEWYEPRLLGLLRRRQAGEEALRRSHEMCQDLRAQLRPLREEVQKLELQRTCLEERITLMDLERRENMQQFRETMDTLDEALSQLRTELQVQKKRTQQMEMVKARLEQEAETHRSFIEKLGRRDHQSKQELSRADVAT